jgi:putative radical SAM enzyme (TIGR03279 family)
MPRGLRPSLYIKDDDYRYSFLFGSYITLTNLTEEDWARIEEQHLSPLYVSVHATDPDLRRRMLGNPRAPDVLDGLRRLARMGVEVHTQLVLVPGLNDGTHLDRSIGDLADLYPSVRSVSVVPVGLTKYHRGGCRPYTPQEMREVWEQVTAWQRRLRRQLGVRFVYLSDEWYLRLGEAVPPRAAYDGLDLAENGVGLVRALLDRWREVERTLAGLGGPAQTWVTGVLMAPVLEGLAAKFADRTGIRAVVVPVPNRFFRRDGHRGGPPDWSGRGGPPAGVPVLRDRRPARRDVPRPPGPVAGRNASGRPLARPSRARFLFCKNHSRFTFHVLRFTFYVSRFTFHVLRFTFQEVPCSSSLTTTSARPSPCGRRWRP